MKRKNKFTIIVPCYNNSQYMKECTDSLVGQTYKNIEIIIVNDGSTPDHSKKIDTIVESYNDKRIIYVKNKKNLSIPISVNIGMDLSTGDYISYHGNDDISNLERFKELNNFILDHDGGPVLLTSGAARFTSNINERWKDSYFRECEDTPANIKQKISSGNRIVGGACCWDRLIFEKIGYFDPAMLIVQDYNYWMRALSYFEIKLCKKDLYYHRLNPHSIRRQNTIRNMRSSSEWLNLCQTRAKTHTIIKDPGYDKNDFLIIKGTHE